jgi:hypothetical protein
MIYAELSLEYSTFRCIKSKFNGFMEKGDIVFPGCLFKGKFQFFLLAINVFTFESVIIHKKTRLYWQQHRFKTYPVQIIFNS